jgi:hypothetical protein
MSGWLPLSRAIFSDPRYVEKTFTKFQAIVWLAQDATTQDGRTFTTKHGSVVTLKRGQVSHSLRYLETKFGWSKSKVHRFLKALEADGVIEITRLKVGQLGEKVGQLCGTASGEKVGQLAGQPKAQEVSVITICNYDELFGVGAVPKSEGGTASGTASLENVGQVCGTNPNKDIIPKNKKDPSDLKKDFDQNSVDEPPEGWDSFDDETPVNQEALNVLGDMFGSVPKTPFDKLVDIVGQALAGDFLEHRRQRKKPMTDIAIDRLAKKLSNAEIFPDPAGSLDLAIERGWLNPVAPKDLGGGHAPPPARHEITPERQAQQRRMINLEAERRRRAEEQAEQDRQEMEEIRKSATGSSQEVKSLLAELRRSQAAKRI